MERIHSASSFIPPVAHHPLPPLTTTQDVPQQEPTPEPAAGLEGHDYVRNRAIVQDFNQGLADETSVFKVTTRAIKYCGKNWQRALRHLDELQQTRRPGTTQDLHPNPIIFNAAIGVCANAGRGEEANHLFNAMLADGHAPDALTYRGAIAAYLRAGNLTDALGLYRHLTTYGPALNVYPRYSTYRGLLLACGKAGRHDEAMQIVEDMLENSRQDKLVIDIATYNHALTACTHAQRMDEAVKVYQDLLVNGSRRDVHPNAGTRAAMPTVALVPVVQWVPVLRPAEQPQAAGPTEAPLRSPPSAGCLFPASPHPARAR